MKILTLLRHAKSTWDDPVAKDFDRPLNVRGRRAAQTVGREMQSERLRFDAVRASPAVRVVETLDDIETGLGRPLAPDYDRRLYLAAAETLLEIVQETDDSVERLLIVGHNPGLEQLLLLLTAEGHLRDEAAIKYPTATLAEIRFDADSWHDVKEGGGTLIRFVRPRDLDPALGPDEDSY